MLTLFLLVVFAISFAFLFKEGAWSNAIRLISVVFAALVATNFYEFAADKLEEWGPSYMYYWDFLALWGLFIMTNAILRGATDIFSKVKVRFRKLTEQIGSPLLAIGVGWVMVCFTAMSMHLAPLPKSMMGYEPGSDQKMFLGLAPDVMWLSFTKKLSKGSLSQSVSPSEVNIPPAWKTSGVREFDPEGSFINRHAARRAELEKHVKETGSSRILKDKPPAPVE